MGKNVGSGIKRNHRKTANKINIIYILLFIYFVNPVFAATYYVNSSSDGSGDGTSQELSGANAAWKNIYQITGLLPGDSVFFHRGDSWTKCLQIINSGEPNNYITFGAYGTGEDPLIDVSGVTYATPAIWVLGVDYVEIKNFRLKGNGGLAAMNIRQFVTKSGSGAMGDGYTITVRDVNILSNYGASEGNHDGFSLQAGTNSSSQVLFYNITATKCRHATEYGGSHQCLTLHQNSKAKVYGANFSDSVDWYVGTEGSQAEIYNLTATSCTAAGIAVTPGATSDNFCYISDSNLTADGGTGKLFGVSSGASKVGDRIIIENSVIRSTSSSRCANNGNIRLVNNDIFIDDPNWSFTTYEGKVTLENNRIYCGKTYLWSSVFETGTSGILDMIGNYVTIGGTDNYIVSINGISSPQPGIIKNNIFNGVSECGGVIRIW